MLSLKWTDLFSTEIAVLDVAHVPPLQRVGGGGQARLDLEKKSLEVFLHQRHQRDDLLVRLNFRVCADVLHHLGGTLDLLDHLDGWNGSKRHAKYTLGRLTPTSNGSLRIQRPWFT
jgi:hypothetical protein